MWLSSQSNRYDSMFSSPLNRIWLYRLVIGAGDLNSKCRIFIYVKREIPPVVDGDAYEVADILAQS